MIEPLAPAGREHQGLFLVGVDTGGTFTDCAIVDGEGHVVTGKALSTKDRLEEGVLDALRSASEGLGLRGDELLARTAVFCHATTAGLNELYTRTGAKVALVTTRGHEDAVRIGRVFLKASGLGDLDVTDVARLDMPAPLLEPTDVIGVAERVDVTGAPIVALGDDEVERVMVELAARDLDAVAVSLLWSFANPDHERRLAEAIRARFPHLYVTRSSEVAPVLGEYERSVTSIVNSYVGPTLRAYLDVLRHALAERGLRGQPLMMQSNGGVFPLARAAVRAVNVLNSGPAGGVIASALTGRALGHRNIITTDVGGTSFDVSLVVDGEPILSAEPQLDRFAVFAPMIDVRSIGAGGGSIAYVDPEERALRVGPRSAGAEPGPACYGRGGTLPTVTDANLVLGRLDSARFFGGRLPLDVAAAVSAIETHVARPMDMSVVEAASGIVDIADNAMADLVRRMTTERGYDARDFTIYAFGGGGPVHVAAYGATIGVRAAVVPAQAPVFSALGVAAADAQHFARVSAPGVMPVDAASASQVLAELAQTGRDVLGLADVPLSQRLLIWMRFRNQTQEVAVPVDSLPLSAKRVSALAGEFIELYERRYGRGTAVADAPIEAVTYEVVTTAHTQAARLRPVARSDDRAARTGTRSAVFGGTQHETAVFDGALLSPGRVLEGPALVDCPGTTVVVHPGQVLSVDDYGNFELVFTPSPGGAR
jgi:N-methylhydantoinase A